MASDERSSDEPAAASAATPPASAAPAAPAESAPSAAADPPPPSAPFEPAPSRPVSASDDPFGPLPAGALVGKYEIAGILGQGAFGITYLARDTQLRRDVAVKEYLPTAFAKRQGGSTVVPRSQHTADDFQWGRDRFVDEARTLASLEDAPGIVNVHDFMEANGTAYMVMALVRGETVEARLKRETRLPEAVIAKMLPPLLDGLELVHAAGFLHRDIKPANILLDPAGRPTLIDFGASRVALEARTQVMTAVYTPGYAPFEQSSSAKQGPWTDVYALCATLYHCVEGSPPPSAIDRMVEDRLKPAAVVGKGRYPPALLVGIDAGLGLRAPDRPQTIAELRRALKGFGGAGAAHHQPAGRPRDDGPATGRGRAPMWIAAGVAALALIGGGAWYAMRPPTDLDLATERARRVAADDKARAEAELARKAATAEAERKSAAEATERQRAADEATRKAEAERTAAEAAARQRIAAEVARNAEAQKAAAEEAERQRLAAEAARKAAAEKAAAEEAERQRAAAEAERKAVAEKAAAEESERQRVAAAEAARKAAAEKAAAEEVERQRVAAEAARRAAAEKAAAEDAERQRVAAAEAARKAEEEKARALADARRQGEAAEAALRLTEIDRKRVQIALTSLGHSTQGSDGSFGPRSRAMIAAWQKSRNEAETGYLTGPQLAALRTQAAPALARYDEEQRKAEEDARRLADEKDRREEDERRRQAAVPAPAAPPARPAPPPATAALPAGGVDGAWSGTVDCAPGLRETVTFNIVGGAGIARLAASQGALVLRVAGTNANAQMTWRDAAGVDYEGTAAGVVAGASIRLQGNARGGGRAATCSVTLTRR